MDLPIVVQKYGGSSVADPNKLGHVADRVVEAVKSGRRVVVVVSAMGKTTDELLALARTVAPSPPRRELDMLLSAGERISMALLAMALESRGVDAISFTGSQSGILTNDRHSGARIIEVRPVRIEDELARGRVVIVAGFQGMSYKREITTLGRGGSDTTAVALAAALAADCEIYSDVDGVYSADPRVVSPSDVQHLPFVGYEEMQELAEHGARVLNAQAVEWARRAKIIIHARATSGSARETVISERHFGRVVTGTRRITRVSGGRDPLRIVEEERITLRHGTRNSLRFVRDDVPDWPRVEKRFTDDGAELVEEGAVTIVGPGIDVSVIRRVMAAANPSGWESAPLRLTLYVECERVDEVTRLLHDMMMK